MLSGKKTYIVGVLMILYGGTMMFLGQMEQAEAITLVMEGFGLMAIRAGISKGAE